MLWALPFIALPIVIHLINQRRYQSVPWAAMVFLLAANKMSTGYARLRRYLILAARTLAVAGLVFAVARPLSSGWLGLAVGSRADTTILVIDRSPSMGDTGPDGRTKLQSLTSQLVDSLGVVRSNRYVLIHDDSGEPIELDSLDAVKNLKVDEASASTADIAGMMEQAAAYIRTEQPGSVELWVLSDMRRSDWSVASGRWSAINQSIRELPQTVRIHLLASPNPPTLNRSVRVTDAKRNDGSFGPDAEEGDEVIQTKASGSELLLSLVIQQFGQRDRQDSAPTTDVDPSIPVELDLNGAKSELTVKLTGDVTEVAGIAIPLDAGMTTGKARSGWGSVSLPADANREDNTFHFVYGDQPIRKTIVVCEDAVDGQTEEARPLVLAAGIPPDDQTRCEAMAVTSDEFLSTELDGVALVLWTEALPDETTAYHLESFLRRGGRVLFFAPETTNGQSFDGLTWGDWQASDPAAQVATWIGDHDLLSSVRSGDALPVGEIRVTRHRMIEGSRLPLAYLPDESPLLARSMGEIRGVYVVSTAVDPESSTLASNGIVLYAMLQRALADGAGTLGVTRQIVAAETNVSSDEWNRLSGPVRGTSNHLSRYAGVYQEDERLIAVNRSEIEDTVERVDEDQLAGMFNGLDFDRIEQETGTSTSLVQEIWRLFLTAMLIALLCEALLCLPKKRSVEPEPAMPGTKGIAA